jgi:hypothetical protein
MKTASVSLALLFASIPLSHLRAAEPLTTPAQPSIQQQLMLSTNFEDADLGTVASMVAKQANVNAMVDSDLTGLRVPSFMVNNVSVEEALRAVAVSTNTVLTRIGNTYLFTKKGSPPPKFDSTPAVPAAATKPFVLEFAIGKLLAQSVMVAERDTFSMSARIGEHWYAFSGSNELTTSGMKVTMDLTVSQPEASTPDQTRTIFTHTSATDVTVGVRTNSFSTPPAQQVAIISVDGQEQRVTMSVTKPSRRRRTTTLP